MNGKTALERAFELADQGVSLRDIRVTINKEGYELGQLYGLTITKQIGRRIAAATAKKKPKSRSRT